MITGFSRKLTFASTLTRHLVLRNTINQERLDYLALKNIEHDLLREIDTSSIILNMSHEISKCYFVKV